MIEKPVRVKKKFTYLNYDKNNKIKLLLHLFKSFGENKRFKARVLLSRKKARTYDNRYNNFKYLIVDIWRKNIDLYTQTRTSQRKMEIFKEWR